MKGITKTVHSLGPIVLGHAAGGGNVDGLIEYAFAGKDEKLLTQFNQQMRQFYGWEGIKPKSHEQRVDEHGSFIKFVFNPEDFSTAYKVDQAFRTIYEDERPKTMLGAIREAFTPTLGL